MIRYAGLDVHKRVVEACLLDDSGQIIRRERFTLTVDRLLRFAQEHLGPQAKVVVEATTNTWSIVRLLKREVGEVIVSNPLQTKAIAQAKVKTDKVDAYVLAQLLRCDFLPRVWQPDEATQEIRRLTSRRSALIGDRTALKNRLHSVLAQRLITAPVEDLFSPKGLDWLKRVELDAEGRLMVDSDLTLLAHVNEQIAVFDGLLATKAYADDDVKLLITLPGVDVTCAQAVRAALGDLSRFRDGDHAASYLGLVPSTKQSANHCYHGPITKAGNSQARWMLVQSAQQVGRHPGPLGAFFRRLAKRKNRNVAVVATARKLAVIAWHLLTDKEPYRYAQPHSTAVKLARLRIRATGQKRRSGRAPGTKRGSKLGPGICTRTIKPLAQVYAAEQLPPLKPAPPGEARTLADSHTGAYVASLAQSHTLPCRPRRQPQVSPGSTTSAPK